MIVLRTSSAFCSDQVASMGSSIQEVPISKITIDLVPVGDPGNNSDTLAGGFGSVPIEYQIGKYDVTAEQYCTFLNAIAKKDTHHLYNTNMGSDSNVATILRSGDVDNYSYTVIAGREKFPITYVRWFAAIRFCNWLENGQPTGDQTLETTEGGTFNPNEKNQYGTITPGSKWCLPTEDQWYKAAYFKTSRKDDFFNGYWRYWGYETASNSVYLAYGTANNAIPGNKIADARKPNQANYSVNGVYTTLTAPRLTPVGLFTASASSYGAYDMAGNVYQWTLGMASDNTEVVIRGGSWNSPSNDDLCFASTRFINPNDANSTLGFRVVYNVAPKKR